MARSGCFLCCVVAFLCFVPTDVAASSCADVPSGALNDVPCLDIPRCPDEGAALRKLGQSQRLDSTTAGVVSHFWVNTVPGFQTPAQATHGFVCHNEHAIQVHLNASDDSIFSPWTACNDPVFEKSDVMEVFIAPVESFTDAPQLYHELDTGAAGALWGACFNNSKGNVTYTTCDPVTVGNLPCSGAATFPDGLTTSVVNGSGWWAINLTVPWAIFPSRFRPQERTIRSTPSNNNGSSSNSSSSSSNQALWPWWRLNLYRYSYPDGPGGKYELNAWSPTHTGSFHEPHQFGIAALV